MDTSSCRNIFANLETTTDKLNVLGIFKTINANANANANAHPNVNVNTLCVD